MFITNGLFRKGNEQLFNIFYVLGTYIPYLICHYCLDEVGITNPILIREKKTF